MTDWVDFKAVKEAVSMEMTLAHYGIQLRKVNNFSLRGDCPLPTHSDDATKNSFSVNTEKNAWACQSASCVANRDGKKGGNVLDFVAEMEGCSVRDAALKLQNWFRVVASNEPPENYVPSRDRPHNGKKQLATERNSGGDKESVKTRADTPPAPNGTACDTNEVEQEVNQPLEFALKSVDSSHEYLRRRGIREETAEHFGAGYFFGKGSMSDRIVIPIHNEVGGLVAYAGRSIDDSEPKYKLPPGFKKSLVLFNLHRVLETKSRVAILVEGYFDAMKLHQAGFPNVVSLMGSALSDHQEQLLIENFDQVIVMLDNDKGGQYAATQIVASLMNQVFVRVVDVPDGKQPDQLSTQEIQALLAFLNR